MSYPDDTFLITQQAMELAYNPKVFYCGVGVAFPSYRDAFGPDVVEGVMGPGAWNPKVPYDGAEEYFAEHVDRWDAEPDRWASAFSYASVQVLEQAIEKAGSLDRNKVRDVIASGTFPTVIGPVEFEDGFNQQSPGEVGQWQSGEFEIIGAKEKQTADPQYPRQPWPVE
jgi:branched-chain amino acid transport system substrate-binding protein